MCLSSAAVSFSLLPLIYYQFFRPPIFLWASIFCLSLAGPPASRSRRLSFRSVVVLPPPSIIPRDAQIFRCNVSLFVRQLGRRERGGGAKYAPVVFFFFASRRMPSGNCGAIHRFHLKCLENDGDLLDHDVPLFCVF